MVLITDNLGQLGNQIFRLAHFVAFAERTGISVGHAQFERYGKYFPYLSHDPLSRYPRRARAARALGRLGGLAARALGNRLPERDRPPVAVVRLKGGEECDLSSQAFVQLAQASRLVLVSGFLFRDYEAFARHSDVIRSVFTPHAHHLEAARRSVDLARADADRVVGVHIRRGDYAHWNDGRYYWSDGAYAGLMAEAAAHWPNESVRFLICSNDSWSSAAFPDDVVPGPGQEIEDMYALAHCDAILGPPSTFTSWASFWGRTPLWSVSDLADQASFDIALKG